MVTPRVILIAGPTASGKSAFALRLAQRVRGTIVNADSMQVYRDLAVLTARPSAADMHAVPHLLYGVVDGAEAYSVGRYVADARAAIAAVHAERRTPILTGGTGLYFKALLEGLSPIPTIPADVRAFWRREAERRGAPDLHAELARRDPASAATLQPNDSQRIVRALEVLEATGQGITRWQQVPGIPVLDPRRTLCLLVTRGRADLLSRADARFDKMMTEGAVEEVRELVRRDLPRDLPVMRALGVHPIARMLAGEWSAEDAAAGAKAETRAYIKRQLTWAKNQMMSWKRIKTQ